VYDLQGRYLRTFGETFLNSPSGFVQWGNLLVVADLYARLAVLDVDDKMVGYIGADPNAEEGQGWPERPGWPNALADDGHVEAPHLPHRRPVQLAPLRGRRYRWKPLHLEWLIGGRYTKLTVRP